MPVSTAGSGTPRIAEHAAERHHQRKHDRQDPDRRRAEERAPQPDRHHRDDMIRPEHRMREAGEKAAGAFAGMRERGRRDQQRRADEKRSSRMFGPVPTIRYDSHAMERRIGQRSAEIDRIVRRHVRAGAPGLALAVVRDGEVAHLTGYGLANVAKRTPVTPRTQFHIASCGKQFTGLGHHDAAAGGQAALRRPHRPAHSGA